MTTWFWYAILAAVLYGLHQVFTKLAAEHIGDGLGGFVVETTAALTIAVYLGWHGSLGNVTRGWTVQFFTIKRLRQKFISTTLDNLHPGPQRPDRDREVPVWFLGEISFLQLLIVFSS